MLKLERLSLELGAQAYQFDLQAEAARVTAILGKSGSGKSTLLNLIAGFLQPVSGELSWNGDSLLGLNANERPVTTLFQQHNLFTHLNIWQNIGFGISPSLRLNSEDHRRIEAALEQVGLSGYARKAASTLSGGEQQRVALARCLLRNQPVLLLDEPFSALDESTRLEMLELSRRIIDAHQLCVILVTHNEDDADRFAARKLRLRDGRLHA